MLKNILLILLFFTQTISYSQVKLESGFGLTYCSNEEYRVNDLTFNFNKITALNQLRLERKEFSLISNIAVMFDRTKEKITFTPSLASFDLELRYIKGRFVFSVAHRCVHPIATYKKPLEFSIYGGYNAKFRILYNVK